MKCLACQQEITHVNLFSQAYQRAELEGDKIIDYGPVEELLDTMGIECPLCSADLSEFVKEDK